MQQSKRIERATERGAAMVEAVVALPLFVLLFVGLCFFRQLTSARLEADEQVRRCAWEFSSSGCELVPKGCEGVVSTNDAGAVNAEVSDVWDAGTEALGSGAFAQAIVDALAKTVIDTLANAFTQTLTADKTTERMRPGVLGAGQSRVKGRYHLACNIKPKNQDAIINQVWDFLVP